MKMYLKEVISKKNLEIVFCWRLDGQRIRIHWSEARIRGSGSGFVRYQNVTDPQHWGWQSTNDLMVAKFLGSMVPSS
jgi:hypothetical protein